MMAMIGTTIRGYRLYLNCTKQYHYCHHRTRTIKECSNFINRAFTSTTTSPPTRTIVPCMNNVIALVTGGCSGLGAGTVQSLLHVGVKGIVVADLIHQKPLYDTMIVELQQQQVQDQQDPSINSTMYVEMDVTNTEQVMKAFDMVEERYGQPPNVIINCAGIVKVGKTYSTKNKSCHPIQDFIQTIHINTIGTFQVASIGAERMIHYQEKSKQQEQQDTQSSTNINNYCIINTASIAGYEGQMGQVAYATSKGGIIGMTLPMARDLAQYSIRVVSIAPGLFATPLLQQLPNTIQTELCTMIPHPKRFGLPIQEYGQLVVHIIQNTYINGTTIRLDGALRMPP